MSKNEKNGPYMGNRREIRFSVIIPTFNRSTMLLQAIEALCDQEEPGCQYEIIPVDNGSIDNTRQMVEAYATTSPVPIQYVFEQRAGSHFARNTGFKAARGEILGLIDDDILVERNWVKNMIRVYQNPEVSCAGGKISLKWTNGPPPEWLKPHTWILGELDYGPEIRELHYPQMINAGNFSIRKQKLFEIGGYNPCNAPKDKLIGDGESGVCTKVYESGGHIFWVPRAASWHVQDAQRITLAYMRRRARFNGMSQAYTLYRKRHGNLLEVLKIIYKRICLLVKKIIPTLIRHKSNEAIFYQNLFAYETNMGVVAYLLSIKTNHRLQQLVCRNNWLQEE